MTELRGPTAPLKGTSLRRTFVVDGRRIVIDFTRVRDNTYRCIAAIASSDRPSVEFTLRIQSTLCNFGGSRPWLECPGCSQLRRQLYVDGLALRCRRCADLAYASQSATATDRLGARIVALRIKLGDPGDGSGRLVKPRGMHWKTYDRMRQELRTLERKTLDAYDIFLEELEQRLQVLDGEAGTDA